MYIHIYTHVHSVSKIRCMTNIFTVYVCKGNTSILHRVAQQGFEMLVIRGCDICDMSHGMYPPVT